MYIQYILCIVFCRSILYSWFGELECIQHGLRTSVNMAWFRELECKWHALRNLVTIPWSGEPERTWLVWFGEPDFTWPGFENLSAHGMVLRT